MNKKKYFRTSVQTHLLLGWDRHGALLVLCAAESMVLTPSQVLGSGLKSATGRVTYIVEIGKCYKIKCYFLPLYREAGC